MKPKVIKGFFSSNRKLVRKLSRSFWVASILLLVVVVVQAYTSAQAQKMADQSYGIWQAGAFQISSKKKDNILKNPMIETAGVQSIAGQIVREKEDLKTTSKEEDGTQPIYEAFGNIGYADENFFKLACLRMKYGVLPTQGNELAVEAEALDALGISYEVGQTISLMIQTEADHYEEQTFILSGVIENYSRFWNGDGSTLRFFVPDAKHGGPFDRPVVENVFIKGKPGYKDVWTTLDVEPEQVFQNDNREISNDALSQENLIYTTMMAGLTFLFGLFLIESTALWIYRHRHEIRLMRVFGIRRSRLTLDLITLIAKAAWRPLLFFALAYIVVGIPMWMSQLMILLGCILLPSAIVILAIYVHSIAQYRPKSKQGPKRKKKHLQKGPITNKTVRHRMWNYLAPNYWVTIGVVLAIQTIWIFSSLALAREVDELRGINSFSDYTVRSKLIPRTRYLVEELELHVMYQQREPISQETKEKIVQNGNLKNVEYYGWSLNNELSWLGMEQSLIYSTQPRYSDMPDMPRLDMPGMLSFNERGEWAFYPETYYYSQPEMIQCLQQQVIEGEVNWENWLQGKEAIIALLPLVETQPGVLNPVTNGVQEGKMETTIHPGTILQITTREGEIKQIPVSGIIREDRETDYYIRAAAYSVHLADPLVTDIYADLKSKENQLSVELELSKLGSAKGLEFINYASDHLFSREKTKMHIIVLICMYVATLAIGLFIQMINEIKLQEKKQTYTKRLTQAGLSQIKTNSSVRTMNRIFYSGLALVFISVFLAVLFGVSRISSWEYYERIEIILCSHLILMVLFVLYFVFFHRFYKAE